MEAVTMAMAEQLRSDLSKLFQMIERDVPIDEQDRQVPWMTVGDASDNMFSLRGEAFWLLRDLTAALARPAMEGGPSLDEAEIFLLGACRRSIDEDEQEALKWLDSKLQEAPRTWTVVRPTSTIQHRADEVVIGSCRFRRGLPELPFEADDRIKRSFPAFTISAEVEAKDQKAARMIAERRFAEALSVVQLSDPRRSTVALGSATLVVRPDDTISLHDGPSPGALLDQLVVGKALRPYFQALSDALDTPEDQRTNWERRTLAAARWLAKALAVTAPSDSLISQMVALEALFVPPSARRGKGQRVAQEVSERWRLHSKTEREQRKWIADLYLRRNETAHAAGAFDDELQVARLADLTYEAVAWAASHVNPGFHRDGQPCRTQAEALSCQRLI
jgi:hypothetical protein